MKHFTQLKTWLALCLTAVSLVAWGETRTENFTSSNAASDQYDCASKLTTEANRRDYNYTWTPSSSGTCFKSGIKLGSGSESGSVTSSNILEGIPAGATVVVKVYAAVWNTDGGKITIVYNSVSETKAASNAAITSITDTYSSDAFVTSTDFTIIKAAGVEELTIASSAKRIIVDKVEVIDIPMHTARFSVNGNVNDTYYCKVSEGAAITFPANPTDVAGKKFSGWTKIEDYSNETTAPSDLCMDATMGNDDVIFYAVFATLDKEESWDEITSVPAVGKYAICSANYFMKAEISSNRFKNGDNTPQILNGKLTEAPASDCIWEISKSGNYYLIKNGDKYAGGTSSKNQGALLSSVNDYAKWTISYNDKFEIVNYGRSQEKADSGNKYLRNNRESGWATYTSGSGSAPRLFKFNDAIYSDYTTSVPIPDFTVTTADADFYSLYLDHAVTVPGNVTAYKGKLDGLTLKLEAIEGTIPANTGVLFKTEAAGEAKFVACADVEALEDNDIKGVAVETEIAAIAQDKKVLVLGVVDGKVGFAQPAEDATTIAANKAYILVPASATAVRIFQNEETGIEQISQEATLEGKAYNLCGQLVSANAKGIVIVNGKKIFNK